MLCSFPESFSFSIVVYVLFMNLVLSFLCSLVHLFLSSLKLSQSPTVCVLLATSLASSLSTMFSFVSLDSHFKYLPLICNVPIGASVSSTFSIFSSSIVFARFGLVCSYSSFQSIDANFSRHLSLLKFFHFLLLIFCPPMLMLPRATFIPITLWSDIPPWVVEMLNCSLSTICPNMIQNCVPLCPP